MVAHDVIRAAAFLVAEALRGREETEALEEQILKKIEEKILEDTVEPLERLTATLTATNKGLMQVHNSVEALGKKQAEEGSRSQRDPNPNSYAAKAAMEAEGGQSARPENGDVSTKSLTEKELVVKANLALQRCAKEIPGMPNMAKFISAIKMRSGKGFQLGLTSVEHADWIRKDENLQIFMKNFDGGLCQSRPQTFPAVAEFVPVSFAPERQASLAEAAVDSQINAGDIASAKWIKPVQRRKPEQSTAFLIVNFATSEAAEHAYAYGIVIEVSKIQAGSYGKGLPIASKYMWKLWRRPPWLRVYGNRAYQRPPDIPGRNTRLGKSGTQKTYSNWEVSDQEDPEVADTGFLQTDENGDGSGESDDDEFRLVTSVKGKQRGTTAGRVEKRKKATQEPGQASLKSFNFFVGQRERAESRTSQTEVENAITRELDLVNNLHPRSADIVDIQEPYFDHLQNTRENSRWYVVYPQGYKEAEKAPRSVMLANWEGVRKALKRELVMNPPARHIATAGELDESLRRLNAAIQLAVTENVPTCKLTPHTKRWWNESLTEARRKVNNQARLSARHRHQEEHPAHEQYGKLRRWYKREVEKAKKDHWQSFVKGISKMDVWDAGRMIGGKLRTGGCTRVASLKVDGDQGEEITDNERKSEEFFKIFFMDKSEDVLRDIDQDTAYPPPAFQFRNISDRQIWRAIRKLSPEKAAGPSGIINAVFQETEDIILPIIGPIFRATFELGHYPEVWKNYDTVAIRKLGWPNYQVPKAYRPIALLDCMGKILSSCLAEILTYESECLDLIPKMQFGGRPGRTTTDALQLLVTRIKGAWRRGKVVSGLFLDIKAAFPSVVPERLIHELRLKGIPEEITGWVKVKLEGRTTRLRFDDFTSEMRQIQSGLDQGCPLSVILHHFSNAFLIEILKEKEREYRSLFVDDTCILAEGNTFAEAHEKLKVMMEKEEGILEEARVRNIEFEIMKSAIVDFSRKRQRHPTLPRRMVPLARPEVVIDGQTLRPQASYKFLGLVVDEELRFKEHAERAVVKGTICGNPQDAIRSRDLLHSNGEDKSGRCRKEGAINACEEVSESTEGSSDESGGSATDNGNRYIGSTSGHSSATEFGGQNVFESGSAHSHAATETSVGKGGKGSSEAVVILPGKEQAIEEIAQLEEESVLYSDRSAYEGGMGAAAVLEREGRVTKRLRAHLGKVEEHTVYEAELAGIILALWISRSTTMDTETILICLDNQAALKALINVQPQAGHYLIDEIYDQVEQLKRQQPSLEIIFQWVPGHMGVAGNESSDGEAKRAAKKEVSRRRNLPTLFRKALPTLSSASKQQINKTAREDAIRRHVNSVEKLPEVNSAPHESPNEHTHSATSQTRTSEWLPQTDRETPDREVRKMQMAERNGHPLPIVLPSKEGDPQESVQDNPTEAEEPEDDTELTETHQAVVPIPAPDQTVPRALPARRRMMGRVRRGRR
ncbi:hypothetical protein NLI96_g12812 [Meripilus lineatus]|uniref:Reverse transcriptase n=1 Tax=Meripilus lineatus TaxID=2056292 RepID=A0AAD5UP41_9APHY|nr:hypothetical protein NLI96_g12812 [Physisporinus lineatus]